MIERASDAFQQTHVDDDSLHPDRLTMIAEIKSTHNQSTTHRNHGDQVSWLPGCHGSRCHAGLGCLL